MKKIVILFSGSGTNMQKIIESLKEKVEILECITDKTKAKGIEIAKSANIKTTILESKKGTELNIELIAHLKDKNIDLVVCAGFMRILSPEFIKEFKAINIHPSLLPRHRGINAIEKSFEDEFDDAGITIHFVDEGVDTGKIISQVKLLKKEGENFQEFGKRIQKLEHENYSKIIEKVLFTF